MRSPSKDLVTEPPSEPIIIYIAGWGRSGSTLVARLLAESLGAFDAGEVRFIWERGIQLNQLCSCGVPFNDCVFWTQVSYAFGGWDSALARRMIQYERSLQRTRTIPYLLVAQSGRLHFRALTSYVSTLQRLYRAISDVSGCRAIIDSSKDAPYGALLRATNLDIRAVHLVRDSRAAAYSWMRRRVRPEIANRLEYMPRYGIVRASWYYLLANLSHELIAAVTRTGFRIRYEDFARDPIQTMAEITGRVGVAVAPGSQRLNHSVSGNPLRMNRRTPDIRLDDEWERKMPARSRAVVSLLTFPLLRLYRYPFSSSLLLHPRRR